jgi:hypothetical protein
MMTDQELLTYAAKACGKSLDDFKYTNDQFIQKVLDKTVGEYFVTFNPLHDNCHAFQLMVWLNFEVDVQSNMTDVYTGDFHATESHLSDKCSATRRAIVIAAAEIGKGM